MTQLHLVKGCYLLGTSLTTNERDFNRADSLLKKSLGIALLKNDSAFITLSLSNLGWNFYLEKKYDSAIASYNKSLSYSIPAKIFRNSANSLGNLGTIYRDMGETEKSIQYYLKSIDLAKLDEDVYDLSWVYEDMSQMYLRKSDTSNAFKSYVLFKNTAIH